MGRLEGSNQLIKVHNHAIVAEWLCKLKFIGHLRLSKSHINLWEFLYFFKFTSVLLKVQLLACPTIRYKTSKSTQPGTLLSCPRLPLFVFMCMCTDSLLACKTCILTFWIIHLKTSGFACKNLCNYHEEKKCIVMNIIATNWSHCPSSFWTLSRTENNT